MARCGNCGNKSDKWIIKQEVRHYSGSQCEFDLPVNLPYCPKCGKLVYDKKIEAEIREKAYNIINGINNLDNEC